MKNVLAVLVNYGDEQLNYLDIVLKELKSFQKYQITTLVVSNTPINNTHIDELILIEYLPNFNYLPILCREVIYNYKDQFDYYIFNENDHLIKEIHLDKFIKYNNILPENRIAGLIQYEVDNNGNKHYPAYHAGFEWDFDFIEEYGKLKFAHFSNVHQACFIITNLQLNNIGEKFKTTIGNSIYGIKERTNSDIYENCGMKKLICLSEFGDNLVHHLPNLYIGGENGRAKLGSDDIRMKQSINKLFENYINKI
jgi:hypothetical protein